MKKLKGIISHLSFKKITIRIVVGLSLILITMFIQSCKIEADQLNKAIDMKSRVGSTMQAGNNLINYYEQLVSEGASDDHLWEEFGNYYRVTIEKKSESKPEGKYENDLEDSYTNLIVKYLTNVLTDPNKDDADDDYSYEDIELREKEIEIAQDEFLLSEYVMLNNENIYLSEES